MRGDQPLACACRGVAGSLYSGNIIDCSGRTGAAIVRREIRQRAPLRFFTITVLTQ
jgi:hypothetical protein